MNDKEKHKESKQDVEALNKRINELDKLNRHLSEENERLKKIEKLLRKQNDEHLSLEENYAASLEEAKAVTDELASQNKILADNEARFRTLNEIVPAAIFIVQENKFIYTNKAFYEITGYKKEETESLNVWDVIHPAFHNITREEVLKQQNPDADPVRYEFMIVTASGENRWIDFSAAFFEYEGIISLIGTSIDITNKKEAEKLLKINRFSVESATDSILWLKKDGSFIYANKAACKMLGYSLRELLSIKVFDIAPEYQSDIWPEHWEQLRKKSHMVFETIHRTKSGKDIPVETAVNYLKIQDEEYNFAFSRDISERIHHQNLILENEEKFRNIFNSVNEAILIHHKENGEIIEVNDAACHMYGYNSTDFLKLSFDDISMGITPYAETDAKAAVKKAVTDGPHVVDWISKNKQGKLFHTEVSLRLAKIGQEERVIAVVRDISDRKKSEEELIKAKNRAEEADRLKTAFLANMSHEIRTPMNGILGFTELLLEEELNEEERNYYLSIVRKNGDQLLTIINDILDVSKIEVGQISLNVEYFSLSNLFNELETIFTKTIKELNKNIELIIENKLNDDQKIHGDPYRIRQILTNLLSNAIKFTQHGQVSLGCQSENNAIQFWVSDTGIGLNKHEQNRIFERFIQVDNSHSREHGGTGLGLSISKGLISLMNGKLWLESEEGKGSTFYFTIPQAHE